MNLKEEINKAELLHVVVIGLYFCFLLQLLKNLAMKMVEFPTTSLFIQVKGKVEIWSLSAEIELLKTI